MNNLKNAISAIKVVGIEAISAAKSGHPGIVLGAATTMATLFASEMTLNPENPDFFNRDRFVLSAGHGSALLYATLAAAQIKGVNVQDLQKFRQYKSKFAGHPERLHLPTVEITTGPLAQGVATSVGIALAEARLAAKYKLNDESIINHYTFCLFGDGCMQEGLFHEAVSIAAHYNLKKLILLYDSNDIQLDGPTKNSECIKNETYFNSLNFDYQLVDNGEDVFAIQKAIQRAKNSDKPSIIEIKTIIGLHSSLANSAAAHGAPLKDADIELIRNTLNYSEQPFNYSSDVYEAFKNLKERGLHAQQNFENKLKLFALHKPELATELNKIIKQEYNLDFIEELQKIKFTKEASRNMFGACYQIVTAKNPQIISLIADLSKSTKVYHYKENYANSKNYLSANYNLGVREFAMQAIINGVTAHGGQLAVGSTFLVFSDYLRSALRVAAISQLSTLTVFSHDSITVGEDGPTHQPIEHLWSLRLIPNIYLSRPTNIAEIIETFKMWLDPLRKSPVVCCTSRSAYEVHETTSSNVAKGGYIIYGLNEEADLTLISSGSEIDIAVQVAKKLETTNFKVAVVSLWCTNLFDQQSDEYINKILGNNLRISIEYGSMIPWSTYADIQIGLNQFGVSGKPNEILADWELDVDGIVNKIKKILQNQE